jgi:hypothetical protein
MANSQLNLVASTITQDNVSLNTYQRNGKEITTYGIEEFVVFRLNNVVANTAYRVQQSDADLKIDQIQCSTTGLILNITIQDLNQNTLYNQSFAASPTTPIGYLLYEQNNTIIFTPNQNASLILVYARQVSIIGEYRIN